MYKNNSRDSIKFKGCSSLQLSSNLTGKCHAAGYYSYTHPLNKIAAQFCLTGGGIAAAYPYDTYSD